MSRVASAALAAGLGTLVALGGLELWLGWWTDRLPSQPVGPTLGTLQASATLMGLWDPTLQFDDTLGWTLAPGAHPALDGAGNTPAAIGPHANRLTGADDRPDAAHRMAVFGDSFVFGYGVEDHETFAAQAAEVLGPDWQVTNHGVSGYGDDQVALAMDRWLSRLAPDVVVVGHTGDDVWRNGVSYSYAAKRRSWLEDGAWRVAPPPVHDPYAVREDWRRRPLIRHLPALVWEAWTHGGLAANRALAEAIVHAQVDRIEAAGAIPVLVDVAVLHAEEANDAVIANVCAARELACVDAMPVQRAVEADGLPVFTSDHYSAETNARLGRKLAEVVRRLVDR